MNDDRLRAMLAQAQQRDPSIEPAPGLLLLRACLEVLAEEPDSAAPEVARRVLARYRAADPSWTAHLASVAVHAMQPH